MQDSNNICPCTWHEEDIARFGACHCGLFVSQSYAAQQAVRPRAEPEAASVRYPRVVVYAAYWCPLSQRDLAFLRQSGVPHVVLDIERHPDAASRTQWGDDDEPLTPVVEIDGQRYLQPTPEQLAELLGIGPPGGG